MEDSLDPSRNDQNGRNNQNGADRASAKQSSAKQTGEKQAGDEQAGDEKVFDEVVDALPGSGQLHESDDDLDGAQGPIQVP